jgi:hypothetical protein
MKKKLPSFPQRVKKIAKAVFFVSLFFILTALTILFFYLFLPGSVSTTVFILAVATIPSTFIVSIATAVLRSWFVKVFHDTFTLTTEVVGGNVYHEEVAKNEIDKVIENYDTWKSLQTENDLTSKHFELLITTIKNGHLELFNFFLEKLSHEINYQDIQGNTALHYAVMYNRNDMIKRLLKVGVDRTIQNGDQKTAIDLLEDKCNNEQLKKSNLYLLFTKKFPAELSTPRKFSLNDNLNSQVEPQKRSRRLSFF